jgi:purine-binding chemotaxis protein CheW
VTAPESDPIAGAAGLREAFDAAFAAARPQPPSDRHDFLAIRVGGDPFAVRAADLGGLFAERRIVPVPSPVPEFLGLTSFRSRLVPVYDLRRLLGYAGGPWPRWLGLLWTPTPIGLAFDSFEAHVRTAADPAIALGATGAARHVAGAVSLQDVTFPLLDLASLRETIACLGHPHRHTEES